MPLSKKQKNSESCWHHLTKLTGADFRKLKRRKNVKKKKIKRK